MTKTTYIFVLAALMIGMILFGTDVIGQPPPPGGYGNHGAPGGGGGCDPADPECPLEISIILFLGAIILSSIKFFPNLLIEKLISKRTL